MSPKSIRKYKGYLKNKVEEFESEQKESTSFKIASKRKLNMYDEKKLNKLDDRMTQIVL